MKQEESLKEQGVKEDYEKVWETAYEQCKEIIDQGETDLSRIVTRIRKQYRFKNTSESLRKKYIEDETSRKKTGYIVDRQLLSFYSINTKYQPLMLEPLKIVPIIDSCPEGVERIIELGSGWGRNLFKVWLNGGPKDATYLALDITKTGAKIADTITTATKNIDLRTHYFDYNNPDFSFLTDYKKTVVFTNHSIEQIPFVKKELFEKILEIPGFLRCIHFEPVGFQIPGDSWLAVPRDISIMSRVDKLCANYAESSNLNRNFYKTLRELEVNAKVLVRTVRKHYYSGRLENASSLIIWDNPNEDLSSDEIDRNLLVRDDLHPFEVEAGKSNDLKQYPAKQLAKELALRVGKKIFHS